MIWRRLAYLSLCLLVVGCGSSTNNVTGTWTFSSVSSIVGNSSASGSLTLMQTGNGVTGSLSETNNNSYNLTMGTVTSSQINFPMSIICQGTVSGTLTLTGTISSSTALTGSYSENDACLNDSGTWTAGKVQ